MVFYAKCERPIFKMMGERGRGADLERRDVGMGHVAVNILDLGQVLLGHVHELGGAHLVGEPRESLVKRRRVVFLVVVLLRAGKGERGKGGTLSEKGRHEQRQSDEIHKHKKSALCYCSQK